MSSGPSGTQVKTQESRTEPWKVQVPYLEQGFSEAKRLYESDKPGFFPGSTTTPYSPESEEAFGLQTGQARDPNSLINLAGDETGKTLRGEYLDPRNPVFRGMMEGMTSAVRPGVDSMFARSGRFGSPGHGEAMARGITAGMLPYLQAERGRQAGAVGAALPVSQYAPGLLRGVGGAREAFSRDEKQEELDRFNFEQNIDAQKLREFMQNIQGQYGGQRTTTSTQPTYSNPLATGLGVASTAASIGSAAYGGADGAGFATKAGGLGK